MTNTQEPDRTGARVTRSGCALPYFDSLFERIDRGDDEMRKAFGLHVHWGYWPDPQSATGSVDDFAAAAERLSRQVCDAAAATDGMRVLDVGCGLGGTLASLNQRFERLELVGLNIDARQLERARRQVQPRPSNRIEYVAADACALPFAAESFDAVVAVECIFHFSSRRRFLGEARRVLRPGGRLALSDFVPRAKAFPLLALLYACFRSAVVRTYGDCDVCCSVADYARWAQRSGLSAPTAEDITIHTRPTYPVLRRLSAGTDEVSRRARRAARFLEWATRARWLRYMILGMARKT